MSIVKWIIMICIFLFILFLIISYVSTNQKLGSMYKMNHIIDYKKELFYSPPSLPYQVYQFEHIFSKKECQSIIQSVNMKTQLDEMTFIKNDSIRSISQLLTGQPTSHMEPTELYRWFNGGTIPHYDVIPKNKRLASHTRIATLVFYINDEYIGGELEFTTTNTIIKPSLGKVVLYWNVISDSLATESFHRERFILRGVQWRAIQYVHSQPFIHLSDTAFSQKVLRK